jgi:hypothetical protein
MRRLLLRMANIDLGVEAAVLSAIFVHGDAP